MDWVKLKDTPTVSDLRTAAYEQEKQWENKRIRMRQERALLAAEENANRGKQKNRNRDGGNQPNNAEDIGHRAQNNSSNNTGSFSSRSSNSSSNNASGVNA